VTRLVVNDTESSRRLLRAGRLDVDAFETTGPKADGAAAEVAGVPLLLHNAVWDWSLGHPAALEQDDVMTVTHRRLARTGAPWLSVHVGFSAATVAYDGAMLPTSSRLGRDDLLAAMAGNVRALAARVTVPLLLENLDAQPTGAYDHVCEPAFLRELLASTDASLLLDLAHAQVSASRMGLTVDDYLAGLPLDRVRQLHVSGPRWRDGVLDDAHETLRDADLGLLREVLSGTAPWAVTLEYGRDEGRLLEQLAALRGLLPRDASEGDGAERV
jgi:uncharacterized protein (UPF0276 family)